MVKTKIWKTQTFLSRFRRRSSSSQRNPPSQSQKVGKVGKISKIPKKFTFFRLSTWKRWVYSLSAVFGISVAPCLLLFFIPAQVNKKTIKIMKKCEETEKNNRKQGKSPVFNFRWKITHLQRFLREKIVGNCGKPTKITEFFHFQSRNAKINQKITYFRVFTPFWPKITINLRFLSLNCLKLMENLLKITENYQFFLLSAKNTAFRHWSAKKSISVQIVQNSAENHWNCLNFMKNFEKSQKSRESSIPSFQHTNGPFLKILLAFGAGGLLGDALLHIIPHSLSPHDHSEHHDHDHHDHHDHNHSDHSHDHSAHLRVGIHVISGILVFMMVEQMVRIIKGGHCHSHENGHIVADEHRHLNEGESDKNDKKEEIGLKVSRKKNFH